MPERHAAFDARRRADRTSDPVSAATAISAHTTSRSSRPTSVEMRKPMPTIGVPKNSATIAPISASVVLSLERVENERHRHREAQREQGLPILGAVGRITSRSIAPGARESGHRVHQHREEGHHHDDRGLRLPVEAEPHHHDRRNANDRQRSGETRCRSAEAALQKLRRSIRIAIANPATADDVARKHARTDRLPEIGGERRDRGRSRTAIADGGGRRISGTSEKPDSRLPECEHAKPKASGGARCANRRAPRRRPP